ncbi:MAG: DMT family transporter [Bacillota bacterium]|nr:MAG: DMT family transporter [Bacillota bacterium]
MGRMALAILAAAISGVAMAFQGAFNAALGKRVGLLGTSVAVHVTGATLTAAVIATFFLFGRRAWPGAPDLSGIPWYAYAGGVLSVLIISGVAFAFPVTGAGLGVSTIVTAQLAAAVVLDHFALFGMERNPATGLRILGVILLVVGTRLVAR